MQVQHGPTCAPVRAMFYFNSYLDILPAESNQPTVDKVHQGLKGALTDALKSGRSHFVLEPIK